MDKSKIESISNPTSEECLSIVKKGLKKKYTVNIIGCCEIDYEGRASSYLGLGDRVVLIKPDGTLLVHQDKNRKPVNWQPPGSKSNAKIQQDKLEINSRRTSPIETLSILFEDIYQASIIDLRDNVELSLQRREEEMQERIIKNPELIEKDFRIVEEERKNEYGRIDIFGRDKEGNPVIVELKGNKAGPKAVDQLQRYIENYRKNGYTNIRGILVSPSTSKSAKNRIKNKDIEHIQLKPKTSLTDKTKSLDEF